MLWYNADKGYKYKNIPQQELGDITFDLIHSKLVTVYNTDFFKRFYSDNSYKPLCPLYIDDKDFKWSEGNRNENFRHYFWNLLVKKKFNYYEESEHTKKKYRFDQLLKIALASGMQGIRNRSNYKLSTKKDQ